MLRVQPPPAGSAPALQRAREHALVYEPFYGLAEKPFSLTPDPRFLFRSPPHAGAFDLLTYAIRRREGFVVVTGEIGTGKTTLCRAVLEQLDHRRTFTSLVLNPFISDEDLLRTMLQDFGVVSREEVRLGRLTGVTKPELIATLHDFLASLVPLGAGALLVIDEAQSLPVQVLEQIRILSNLETDREKLLQIVLVGQPNLRDLLRTPGLRQLDQRVSIRCELRPLTQAETRDYVAHRLSVAGGGRADFTPHAISRVHRSTGGVPRLINLVCDRALLGGYIERAPQIRPKAVEQAVRALDLSPQASGGIDWLRRRAAALLAL
jgi:general secretion pathway protein A